MAGTAAGLIFYINGIFLVVFLIKKKPLKGIFIIIFD